MKKQKFNFNMITKMCIMSLAITLAVMLTACKNFEIKINKDTSDTLVSKSQEKANEDMTTDKLVSKAILDDNNGKYMDGECIAEGHIILKEVKNKDELEVYTLATFGEYSFENGVFVKTSGSGAIPTKITFDSNNQVKNIEIPEDGSHYVKSIKEIFPMDLWSKVLSIKEETYKQCVSQEFEYAKKYLKEIGREADIRENVDNRLVEMNASVSNALLDMYYEYPYFIGTIEKIEDDVRFVYEKTYDEKENIVTFRKYEYDTNKIIEEAQIKVNGDTYEYVSGKVREERK